MGYIVLPKDVTIGSHINMWTILEIPKTTKQKILCKCDCGVTATVNADNILRGLSKRCNSCSRKDHMRTHGESDSTGNTRLYRIWKAMKWRCNPKNKTSDHQIYYERGIRVCAQWLHSYETFRDWALANGYKDDLTIDRFPDKNGKYYPTNCRWVGWVAQARNTRSNHLLTAYGETKTLIEWSEDKRCKPTPEAFRMRIFRGWSIEAALTLPHGFRFF